LYLKRAHSRLETATGLCVYVFSPLHCSIIKVHRKTGVFNLIASPKRPTLASRLRSARFIVNGAVFLSVVFTAQLHAKDPTFSEGDKLYALQIKRLFADKCMACHGADPDELGGNFDMRSRSAMLKGGDSFEDEVLIPESGRDSFLYVVTTRKEAGYEMPPKESESLTPEESNWIRQWIDLGAPWPSDELVQKIRQEYAQGLIVKTSGGLDEEWSNRRYELSSLWAYQPLNVVQPPEGMHPVDWFVDRKLQQIKLAAAPPATGIELARRLSFDLTGLPPETQPNWPKTSDFSAAYQADPDHAVEELVAKLMSYPQYGEKFAQHWLDVARYADTAGFANDFSRPNAWRYRDYVIRSFNQDRPYSQFVREQIAGDELNPNSNDHRIATGFLRMGPWEQTGMSVFRITRQQWLDDVTDSVGQTFLGHALQCAKCHDHKFDPIPTRDYYRMMAVFSTTQFAEKDTPFLPSENQSGFTATNTWLDSKIGSYAKQRDALQQKIDNQKLSETGDAQVGNNGLDPGDENSLARINKNISRHNIERDKTKPIALTVYTGKTIERKAVNSRLRVPAKPWDKGTMEPDTILLGGDAYSAGAPVTPGALSAAEILGNMKPTSFPDKQGTRRLALANWITAPDNPLTARVMVNRVWSWHFGKGLAGNPNNLGSTGETPSHPELLDFLANWFINHDWSVKQLNQLLLTSKAYRRSTRHSDPKLTEKKDPQNRFLSTFPPRRLTAEEFRDSMLAVSGELNSSVGGVPCRPDINLEVAMQPRQIMGGTASVYEPDPLPEQRNRRTIYAEKIRGLRDPFMELFNQPGPDKSCEVRQTSTVAPQALTLMNAEEIQDRSLAFAAMLIQKEKSDKDVIRSAFARALGREPTEIEAEQCMKHWKRCTSEERELQHESQTYPATTLRTVMAEKTGEPYEFVEHMPAYESYVPDLQPNQVNARTRGLAQVCLVILNLNEFAYID